jgi:hypothetical protein
MIGVHPFISKHLECINEQRYARRSKFGNNNALNSETNASASVTDLHVFLGVETPNTSIYELHNIFKYDDCRIVRGILADSTLLERFICLTSNPFYSCLWLFPELESEDTWLMDFKVACDNCMCSSRKGLCT